MATVILESAPFAEAIVKVSKEIFDDNKNCLKELAVIGMHTRGVFLAKRIIAQLHKLGGKELQIPFGSLDITLYRDDIDDLGSDMPTIKETEIPFDINKKNIILVDDVLYTGRTIRAALDVLTSFGRPSFIKLAVLVDRGCRELPIEANYIGLKYPSKKKIKVCCKELDNIDQIVVI
ncbi:MAG: bifunctional pyr operon transcriptional regulator/uracil phosphoribosyltransferase PyrR [Elusimicrobiota bacterium]|jgi:pyrimidine operon attenuation protein/uracil phosphoribosyltransferase|nr:bifunctional pyr operon transcriptional regulator/uracil phosphoribosyltransferase PyrR [Elusimicrobiota bacterium]